VLSNKPLHACICLMLLSCPKGERNTRSDITRIRTSIGMDIVKVNLGAVTDTQAHESKPFRCKTVSTVEIAVIPLGALEVDVGKIGESVKA